MNFLTADWRNLILVNYEVDQKVVAPLLPKGLELDTHDGHHFVSLVGFQFLDTRVLGVKWPGLHSFVELNLRFYVKRIMPDGEIRRGVVFIKEIVPSRLITFVARLVYHEPYERWKVHEIPNYAEHGRIGYTWSKDGEEHSFAITIDGDLQDLADGSHEQFIAEHYWGYTKRPDGGTNEYEVRHPSWRYSKVRNVDIECDFSKVYGDSWGFLNEQEPYSIFLAEGSEISVAVKKTF